MFKRLKKGKIENTGPWDNTVSQRSKTTTLGYLVARRLGARSPKDRKNWETTKSPKNQFRRLL